MSGHPFLSPEWIAAVKAIREEYRDRVGTTDIDVRANVTIRESPFGESDILGHLDTTGGAMSLDEGHLDDSDFGIEMPYSVAHQLFVERDPQAVLPILLGGQVRLTGDSSKIMLLAGMAMPPDPDTEAGALARELMGRIAAVTE